MKKLTLILSLIFILSSCNTEPDFFTVSGEISNANGEKLYLVELQTNNILVLDSTILNDKGTFSFKGQTSVPKFYAIRTNSNNYLTLIINNLDQIHVTADIDYLAKNATITGSEQSENILVLRTKLEDSIEKLDSLAAYYQSLIGSWKINQVKDSLNIASQKIIEEHTDYTKDFILENKNSLSGLMALYQQIAPRRYVLSLNEHFEYFNMVDSALTNSIPESDAVKALHSQIEEYKRQKNIDDEINTVIGIGATAPDIALPNPEGDTITLSSLRGKYVLIDFWASWCRPCRVENPNLVKSYKKYHDKGFEIFQVSLDKKKDAWLNAIEKDELNWLHVSDLQYWNSTPAKIYKVEGIPASFLIDKQGRIIAKNLRGDILEAKLSELFN
ncbi:MAG: AhpC/TSA family protein [Bacteroidales bacterium]|nr:AhpC/TSA family protein [Bacteroidales bacterium]